MKKNIIKPSILPGFMELLPQEQRIFDDIVEKIANVYRMNGCLAIDTPIIEKAEVLLAKSGGETEKQVYAFEKGKNKLALRFDLTVPFARYVAQYYSELAFPFKRYQIGKVYRGERNQSGRYREFYQCDVDVIGKGQLSVDNDAWVISLASKAFKAIGLKNYQFQVSNRKILKGMIEAFDIEEGQALMVLIDKYDKMEKESFDQELEKLLGKEKASKVLDLLAIKGNANEVNQQLAALNIQNPLWLEGINELKRVTELLGILGVLENEFEINLKIIRGLDYYTGTVFETVLLGNEKYGSICSGGRYDNLAENYTKEILPGVGISIGLTRLFFVLKEIGFIDQYSLSSPIDYLIIPIGDTLAYCGQVMAYLLEKGYKTTLYFEEDSLKKKMNYANKLNVSKVILIGEEEVVSNQVNIKDMITGQSVSIDYRTIE